MTQTQKNAIKILADISTGNLPRKTEQFMKVLEAAAIGKPVMYHGKTSLEMDFLFDDPFEHMYSIVESTPSVESLQKELQKTKDTLNETLIKLDNTESTLYAERADYQHVIDTYKDSLGKHQRKFDEYAEQIETLTMLVEDGTVIIKRLSDSLEQSTKSINDAGQTIEKLTAENNILQKNAEEDNALIQCLEEKHDAIRDILQR